MNKEIEKLKNDVDFFKIEADKNKGIISELEIKIFSLETKNYEQQKIILNMAKSINKLIELLKGDEK